MKLQIIGFLVVNLILLWNGVHSHDPFDGIHQTLKNLLETKKDVDPLFYGHRFTQFLENFKDHGEKSALFESIELWLNRTMWAEHYTLRRQMPENYRNQISLVGTEFQKLHEEHLNQLNKVIIRNNYVRLSNWTSYRFIISVIHLRDETETMLNLYKEALLALEDSTAKDLNEFGVWFMYFYQAVRRLKNMELIHDDPFVIAKYQKLVAKYVTEKEAVTVPHKYEYKLNRYVRHKIHDIKHKMNVKPEEKIANFVEVSNEMINLYHRILDYAPVVFDKTKVTELFDEYWKTYKEHSGQFTYNAEVKPEFRMIQMGQVVFSRVFECGVTKLKEEIFPED